MFADDFLSISLAEVLGLLVTLLGIWLIVKQLDQARLASQMEGLLVLGERGAQIISKYSKTFREIRESNTWANLDSKEAHKRVYETTTYFESYHNIIGLFEVLGVLVKRKSLDKGMAYDLFGSNVSVWWKTFEKVTLQRRIKENQKVGENWEWLAHEFEKLDS